MKLEDIKIGKVYYYKSFVESNEKNICLECNGTGDLELKSGRMITCDKCRGNGYTFKKVKKEKDLVIYPNHIAYQDGKYYLLESEDDVTYDDGEEYHEIKHTLVPIEEAFEKWGEYNVKK